MEIFPPLLEEILRKKISNNAFNIEWRLNKSQILIGSRRIQKILHFKSFDSGWLLHKEIQALFNIHLFIIRVVNYHPNEKAAKGKDKKPKRNPIVASFSPFQLRRPPAVHRNGYKILANEVLITYNR
jgi:hypothetical protein